MKGHSIPGLERLAFTVAGLFIIAAGTIHLAMTRHVMHWFRAVSHGKLPATAYSAVELNHVVVGILLFPLGLGMVSLAGLSSRGQPAARVALAGATLALASLPIAVWATATREMLAAPPFLTALLCLAAAAAITTAALLVSLRRVA
jgi:hypothetical protein